MKQFSATPLADGFKVSEQARLLAGLTQDLAHCCLGKESEIFAQYGLSAGEGHILLVLGEEGAVTPSRLAARQGVSRSRITPLVKSLERLGFVARSESRHDRRVRDLTLTSRGQEVAEHAANFRLDFHTQLLQRFAESERAPLFSTLSLLHARMRELREEIKRRDDRPRTE
jgi:DNA-binding MarR family transcriptional regulator